MPDAAPAATAPAEAAVPGQLAARKHDESKWPPGVTPVQHVRPIKVKSETGRDVYKYVARLRWLPEGVIKKKDSRYDFIPGSFDSPEAAAAALTRHVVSATISTLPTHATHAAERERHARGKQARRAWLHGGRAL